MPGLVALGRRWSLGSDDLVLPGCTLFVIHVAWLIGLSVILGIYNPTSESCSSNLRNYILGYIVILTACLFVEGLIVFVSLRGTIFYTRPRSYMEYLLYGRTVLLLLCSIWTILGIVWLAQSYSQCKVLAIKSSVLGIVLYNLLLVILILARAWCLYDSAGRSFVHLKRTEKQCAMRRSASRVEKNRVVQLKTRALYEQNWQKRFHRYCCCIQVQEPQESAFTEIALLFSDFFRDLDIVPSDIVAGLMLLREEQKQSRRSVEQNPNNNILKFLSGVPITPDTKFADFSNHDESQEFEELIYYFKYAAAAYGWPVYAMFHPGKGCCHLIGRCLCCRSANSFEYLDLTDDSCCGCNFTALKKLSGLEDADVVYATFHSAVWETPFYVALDHSRRKVIVAVRGTLSMQDWLTDLSADISEIPLDNCPNDWFGHKGMVGAAVNIKKKLLDEMILSRAFSHDPERGSQNYDLVLVGHSLGAGTVSILSILLRPDYPKLQCYAYSPPGGLLSMPVVEYTKEFVTSLVIGKDIVTRVGLSQMECLRADLLDCIKRSTDTKWRIIFDGLLCCREINPKNLTPRDSTDSSPSPPRMTKAVHPTNLSLLLTTHNPLYPPGRIMQIVRTNPKREGLDKRDCAWFAVWRDNTAFDQVLISPVMIGDHLPKNVMTALHKCLQYGRLHGCPNISGQQGNRPSSSPHRQLKKGRDKMETPSSGQSSPSSCLVLNPRSYGDTGPDMNSNMVPSASQVKTGPQSTLNVPQSHLGLGHQTGMQRTASSSPVYASYESLPKTPTADGRAPLARFDTMSEVGSVSSFHSATVEEVKPQQTHRMHDGYCYYVDEDLKSPVNSFQLHPRIDNSPNSNTNNQIVTTAFVEPKPDRTSTSLSDKVLLHRDGSTKVMDRYGNLKGRTSTNDRYRLTYDSGSQSSVNKDPTVRPEQLSLIDKNEHSFGSTENLSSDHSSSLPEALLGQAYTHYHSLSIDSSSPDFEDDIPSPIPHLQQDGTFQHGGVPMETTGLLHKRNDSSVVTMEMDQVRDAERKQGPSMTPSDRVRLLREKYGETKC
ncbi:sn1-specific diacylglycerol lipase alpha-like isoform X2 [Acanthaster planci]|uniref:sn-1-specific diacylglycerol lipase n=1 Tax=Acanthaster planci TaxID=133434 RepID=A0A8B7YNE9_ACAPL|nr:sn1-specific diacylglycerol lipase alpha-like isoform X2 [Acanthaster planci]